MERVTQKDECGYYLVGDGIYGDWGTPEKFRGDDVDRLAAYEDTGLEPEEIELLAKQRDLYVDACGELPLKRIRELARADREGKIHPKYTIGETIYDRFGEFWTVDTVELHSLYTKNEWLYRCGHDGTDDYCALWEFESFPSKEAALRREQE